jgi:hypothetical protein
MAIAPGTQLPDSLVATGDEVFDELWARLARPFEMAPAVAAIVGLPLKAVSQIIGTAVAAPPEAERLLTQFPKTVRSLATSIHTNAERCIGSLRGPVLWSETISARASSFGDPDLFVCQTPSRAYDIDENQVLVYALAEVRDAAHSAEDAAGTARHDDPLLRAVRRNGADASRFVDHPSLRDVRRRRPTARALKRTRSGKHRKTYDPALAMFERILHPLAAADVLAWCDERTRAQHAVLIGMVRRLETIGGDLPGFRAEKGGLYSGPVQYFHPRQLGHRRLLSGVIIGQLLVDVPDRLHDPSRRRAEDQLRARSGGRPTMVVMGEDDLDRAVDRAVELVRGG